MNLSPCCKTMITAVWPQREGIRRNPSKVCARLLHTAMLTRLDKFVSKKVGYILKQYNACFCVLINTKTLAETPRQLDTNNTLQVDNGQMLVKRWSNRSVLRASGPHGQTPVHHRSNDVQMMVKSSSNAGQTGRSCGPAAPTAKLRSIIGQMMVK